jgi:hypothetical protein
VLATRASGIPPQPVDPLAREQQLRVRDGHRERGLGVQEHRQLQDAASLGRGRTIGGHLGRPSCLVELQGERRPGRPFAVAGRATLEQRDVRGRGVDAPLRGRIASGQPDQRDQPSKPDQPEPT